MKAFKKALSELPVTPPILYSESTEYQWNKNIRFNFNRVNHTVQEGDAQDTCVAKEHFVEQYKKSNLRNEIDFYSAENNIKDTINRYLLLFVKTHSQVKHPKNTKIYKFVERLNYYIDRREGADEAFYSLYKYLRFNDAMELESTTVHVQNGFKILEVLRTRFEKE